MLAGGEVDRAEGPAGLVGLEPVFRGEVRRSGSPSEEPGYARVARRSPRSPGGIRIQDSKCRFPELGLLLRVQPGEMSILNSLPHSADDLKQMYASRFEGKSAYRRRVWRELCSFFAKWIPADATVLDLGCGHCEFINGVECRQKFGMDLNPEAAELAATEVMIIQQDCSEDWRVPPGGLDVVFTSNFLERSEEHTSELQS